MATPAPKPQEKAPRQVSLTITLTFMSIDQVTALEIDNRIRDVADDYPGAQVSSNQGNPINFTPG